MAGVRMTGAEALARMLDGYGVTHFFMVPAVTRQTMVELERHTRIARVHAHGEKAAAYMADGYARVSGRPGVCGAQVIGALNLAAGLRDAYLAGSPIIAITGGRDPMTKFRGVYQEVDDVPAFEPVTKFNATVDAVERIPDMLRQAFRVAVTGCPGPVHLQFRGNEAQLDGDEADLDIYVEAAFSKVPAFRPAPDEKSLREALTALEMADRPVIVAGGGVRWSSAAEELQRFAERAAIPVATSLNAKDTMPGDHPLSVGVAGSYSRETANRAIHEADLVCFIGSRTGGMTTNFWDLPPLGTPVVQIDIEPENLGRNYPLVAAVASDAKLALQRMIELLDSSTAARRRAWTQRVAALRQQWRAQYEAQLTSEQIPIRPERICGDLTKSLPDDSIVVADTGYGGVWMGAMYDSSAGQAYIRSAGHLGWAFPASLGAKCAAPDRSVITFTGDAGLWYHVAELETAARWGLDIVTVVNNNSSGIQTRRGFQKVFDRAYGGQPTANADEVWRFKDVDFARVAESMGAAGIRVTEPSAFEPALDKALHTPGPVVIDVVTDIDAAPPLAL
jgi:acetolactate synthase I/II/III large subunit